MRFFVVPGIGQLELNGELRAVWSPLKLRPAAILAYYGYPVRLWLGPGRPQGHCKKGWEWPDRMMDRCQQIILGLILGTEPTTTPPPLPQRRFFQSRSRPPGAKPFCPSNLELITALAIKFRFHLVLWTTKLTRPSGPIFRSEVGYMPPSPRIC